MPLIFRTLYTLMVDLDAFYYKGLIENK